MKILNRFALIVRPDTPYIEFAARIFEIPEPEVRYVYDFASATVYLLPESKAKYLSAPDALKGHWRAIFKEELKNVHEDEAIWPKHRSEAMFRAWFKLELCTLIHDLDKKPLMLEVKDLE